MKRLLVLSSTIATFGLSSMVAQNGWTIHVSNTTAPLYSCKAVSQSIGWIGGELGIVLRTTNGGTTWTNVGGSVLPDAAVAIEALDANVALVSVPGHTASSIFRTTNAGASWSQVFQQVDGYVDGIRMTDANNGFALGDPVGGKWTVLRTTNSGAS